MGDARDGAPLGPPESSAPRTRLWVSKELQQQQPLSRRKRRGHIPGRPLQQRRYSLRAFLLAAATAARRGILPARAGALQAALRAARRSRAVCMAHAAALQASDLPLQQHLR
jgi:hypothetical protein